MSKMARYLIEKCRADVNVCSEAGCSALCYAIETKDTETINLLHDFNADPNLSLRSAKRPLHVAAEQNSLELAVLLLSWGADINLTYTETDKRELSALDVAIAVKP